MSPKSRLRSYAIVVPVVVLIAALVATVVFPPRPRVGLPGSRGTVPGTGDAAPDENPGGQESGLAAWTASPGSPPLLMRAEDVEKLYGKMKLTAGPDNENVLDDAGRRASVDFVWVEDKACAKGEDPAVHRARFELVVDEPGTYYPWARVWWKDSCGDSLAVSIQHQDDEEPTRWQITDGSHQWWHWLCLAGSGGVELKRGTYAVVVENREDGARLSRILFSRKEYESYMPSSPEG